MINKCLTHRRSLLNCTESSEEIALYIEVEGGDKRLAFFIIVIAYATRFSYGDV